MLDPQLDPSPNAPAVPSGAQLVHRIAVLLRVIASGGAEGCRLLDLAHLTKLQRPTVHRILNALVREGMITRDAATRRYQLGSVVFELGLAAAARFDLRQICEPALAAVAERTGDTAFLTLRSGYDSVCLDRKEGSFPIKTLTLAVGQRRPLGVGAGGMALLMTLPQPEVVEIVEANAVRIANYADLDAASVLAMIARGQALGFMLNDRQVTPGALSVALPVPNPHGPPYLALSIGAIASRMTEARQKELAVVLRREVHSLARKVAGARDGSNPGSKSFP